jgi:hypothetical protein
MSFERLAQLGANLTDDEQVKAKRAEIMQPYIDQLITKLTALKSKLAECGINVK